VPYQAGELKAVGYNGNKIVKKAAISTTGKAVSIKLFADRKVLKADNEDLSYITVDLVDSKGRTDPKAENLVKFSIIGNAKIVGVGNADPVSLESCQQPQRKAWKGKCLVIIKAGKARGEILLKAQSPGLAAQQISIVSN
jgi:beta-galactosidase